MRYIEWLFLCAAFVQPIQAFSDESALSQEKVYPASQITFKYLSPHPRDLSIPDLENIPIPLKETRGVLYADQHESMTVNEINQSGSIVELSQSALEQIMKTVKSYLDSRGVHWAVIFIPKNEIDQSGVDLRSRQDAPLTIAIATVVVKEATVKSDNAHLSKKIEENLPSQLPDPSTGYPGDFVNSAVLNQYLHALNRHPNRRVDLEIGPTQSPDGAALDFVVTESTPYHYYFSVNNNTPRPLHQWQESVGFIHTQLTGNDDIFKFNAATDSFDGLYTFDLSYEAPLYRSIKNRWQVGGSFSRFISAEFALPQNLFVGTQFIANAEFISNVGQWDRLFLDMVGDLQYRHIHNRGHFLFASATKNFLLPEAGLKLVQLTRETKLIVSFSVQTTISNWFWDVEKGIDNLGRIDPSTSWAIVQGNLYGSFYLEPLFQRKPQVKYLASEIVTTFQFQNAFQQRLIPQLEGVLGGLYTVRGYPQSTIAGDNFYTGSLEYRFHLPKVLKPRKKGTIKLFGKSLRWAPAEPKGEAEWDFIIRGFYDVGQTTVNQRRHFERNYLIMGAGVGAELILWHNLFLRADWAVGLRAANGVRSGNRQFYFSTTGIF